ncbi:MAG: NAD(P)(+) transhydrogenase (Re/Si-specific) subunit beta [Actinomycetota bacterium]
MSDEWIRIGYLVAAVFFVLGLKGLSRPRTAVRGNLMGAVGMLLAVVVTLADQRILSFEWIAAGVVLGSAIGVLLATRIQLTSMPELVALFNGLGGAASVLVATADFDGRVGADDLTARTAVAVVVAVLIGAVTFSGSIIAFFKLAERLRYDGFGGIRILNLLLAAAAVAAGVMAAIGDGSLTWLWVAIAVGFVLGLSGTLPVGGADMPVVIALLNSLSGVAAAAAGFALDNSLLIIAGSLVGASGLILTQIMCVAMNRSLLAVLLNEGSGVGTGPDADEVYGGKVRSTSAEDVALMLDTAERVVIIPGYGLAVAQAQHAVRDLTRKLQDRGAEVLFGIHPVAGRMPGHMNVLLAEAEIDYDVLIEMDDINPRFEETDVAIVLGANDVVNPAARTDPESPIAGMPILDVDRSRSVVVIKRSLSPGFAGIPNPLFAADNSVMLFGDGKEAVVEVTKALAEL